MLETKITYYEGEEYIESVKKCLEIRYGDEEQKQQEKLPYIDPDCISDYYKCSYFGELTQFLNEREKWLQNRMLQEKMEKKYRQYKYVAPNKCQKVGQAENQYPGSNTNEIIVYGYDDIKGKFQEKFRLKSDQFGFSVGDTAKKDFWTKFEKHPYGYLCKLVKTEAKKDKVYEEIAKCIYHTRTLGGGFLWQVDAGTQNGIYEYNHGRGESYIEDRVDLTLLEIKHLFEWIELEMPKKNAQKKEAVDLFNRIGDEPIDGLYAKVKKYKERPGVSEYIKWLEHFGTFENYIKFFCFDDFGDFVDKGNWMPCDIMKSDLKWKWDDQNKCQIKKRVFLEDPTEYKLKRQDSYKILKNKKLSAKELEQMLENVRLLTLARSYRMQKVIDGTSN